MNPIPNLPTDNLYKFCALTGVVLVVLSVVGAWIRVTELARENVYMEYVQRNVDADQALGKALLKANETNTKAMIKAGEASQTPDQILKWSGVTVGLFEKLTALQKVQTETLMKAKEAFVVRNEANYTVWAGIGGICIGSILGTYGFVNWRRLQLIQDKILLRESLDKKA